MPPSPSGIHDQLLAECLAMVRHALASGLPVTPAAVATVESARAAEAEPDVAALARVHGQLSKLVAPATPRALVLLAEGEGRRRGGAFGGLGVVRRMMMVALASLAVFVACTVAGTGSGAVGTVEGSTGAALLSAELFWLSAAAMGASFAMLATVSGYVVKRCYDPRHEPSYWIRLLLGIMAGFLLVSLVPVDAPELARPTIAMLGGFSSPPSTASSSASPARSSPAKKRRHHAETQRTQRGFSSVSSASLRDAQSFRSCTNRRVRGSRPGRCRRRACGSPRGSARSPGRCCSAWGSPRPAGSSPPRGPHPPGPW